MLKLLGQIIFGALQINRKLFSNYIFLKSSNYELFQLADSKKLTSLFDHAKNLCTLHLLEVCEKKKFLSEWSYCDFSILFFLLLIGIYLERRFANEFSRHHFYLIKSSNTL